jgi:hypothetical protein
MESDMGKEIKKLASKTNRSMLKLWSLLLACVLGILGSLPGCILPEYGPAPAYGVEAAKYIDLIQNQNAE